METSQLNIFDHVRDTQLNSWREMQENLSERHRRVLEVLVIAPAAGFEIAAELGWQLYRTLPRITELVKANLVTDSGLRKTNPESGKKVIVWRRHV